MVENKERIIEYKEFLSSKDPLEQGLFTRYVETSKSFVTETVKVFIEHPQFGDINKVDDNNNHALFQLLQKEGNDNVELALLELFIKKNIDLNAKNCDGQTLLEVWQDKSWGPKDGLNMILAAGFDPKVISEDEISSQLRDFLEEREKSSNPKAWQNKQREETTKKINEILEKKPIMNKDSEPLLRQCFHDIFLEISEASGVEEIYGVFLNSENPLEYVNDSGKTLFMMYLATATVPSIENLEMFAKTEGFDINRRCFGSDYDKNSLYYYINARSNSGRQKPKVEILEWFMEKKVELNGCENLMGELLNYQEDIDYETYTIKAESETIENVRAILRTGRFDLQSLDNDVRKVIEPQIKEFGLK